MQKRLMEAIKFADDTSVDKKNFVGSLQLGVAATCAQTRISSTQVFMTREYKTQAEGSQFGDIPVSYRF
jgi:lipid A 3-O-deacylase